MRHDVQSEILRQRDRVAADFLSREVAVALTCAMFAFILPWRIVGAIWILCLLTEVSDFLCYRGIARHHSPARHAALLCNSVVAFSAFSLLGVLGWGTGDPMLQFIAILTLVGALMNASTARSIHLPLGLACGLPPALSLIWIVAAGFRSGQDLMHSALASVATAILIGYFVAALIQNNRTQADLTAESARARDASAAKSRFIAEMSHEMRTPLNAIGGLALHLRDAADPASRRAAAGIEQAARDLSGLVDEVFDLAAAAEGTLAPRPLTVDIRREARAMAMLLGADAEGHALRVPVSVAPDVPAALRLDPVLLHKLLRLIAAEAARRLQTAPAPEWMSVLVPGDGAELGVTLRFRRGVAGAGPPLRTDAGQSLGAELLAVLSTITGARVRWSDDAPAGPEVTLLLPVSPADPLPDRAAPPDLRALVVDDIATNRFILVQMLRKLNIAATEADSGAAALEALDRAAFDIVLLDMNMPKMDGAETFRSIRIRKTARGGGAMPLPVPVIALTAAGVGNRDRLLALGLDGYVAKPVEPHRLQAEIEAVLAPWGEGAAPSTAAPRRIGPVSSDYPSAPKDAPAP